MKDLLNVVGAAFLVPLEPSQRELAVAADRQQQVVEVVSDPSCKLAECLELLRLEKLLLELQPPLLLRHPRDDGADQVRHGVEEGRIVGGERARRVGMYGEP